MRLHFSHERSSWFYNCVSRAWPILCESGLEGVAGFSLNSILLPILQILLEELSLSFCDVLLKLLCALMSLIYVFLISRCLHKIFYYTYNTIPSFTAFRSNGRAEPACLTSNHFPHCGT